MRLFCLVLLSMAAPAAPPQPIAVVAHRGLRDGVPENTLAAFRDALAGGVAIIELDLRLTKDGHLVVIHDETLDRTTNCSGRVASLTLAGIKQCNAGEPSHGGERVPTFAELLALVRDRPAQLLADVKPGTPLEPVLREIRDHRAEAKVILGLRKASDVASVRRRFPLITTLAFMPEATDAAAFTKSGAHIIRLWSDWVEADANLVARTRALGPEVWVLVGRRLPSKRREWRDLHARMIATGAQGLITDRPELISAP